MNGQPLPVAVADAARHGSYCPKLCTFACPVTTATGRDDAVPWSFHRTVSDLADGRLEPADAASRLTACSGCLACQSPCLFDQDIPEQVVAARSVARPRTDASEAALRNLAAGRRPDGSSTPSPVGDPHADVVVLAGHEDPEASLQAAAALFAAAGHSVAVVAPQGCCGALARAVGDTELADGLAKGLIELVGRARVVVAMDPHCLGELRAALPEATVIDVVTALAEEVDRLSFRQAGRPIVWHDPCVLARVDGVVDAPRRLLAVAGFSVVEPEHHGIETACSGAGLAMPLLDPAAAAATAVRRAQQLAGTGADAVTSCHRAGALLTSVGHRTADLLQLLADLLEDH